MPSQSAHTAPDSRTSEAVRSAGRRHTPTANARMFGATIRLAIRSLLARPLRTILTGLGVVLGVAVILAIIVTNASTLDAVTRVFTEASGKAHLAVVNANTKDLGFSEATLRQVRAAPDVQAAVPMLQGQAVLASDSPDAEVGLSIAGFGGGGLLLLGIDPVADTLAREYKVVDGAFLSPDDGAYEIVLVKNYADEQDVRVGNEIELITGADRARLRVVGLISKEGPGLLNNGALGVIPLKTAQDLFARNGDVDQIDVIAVPGSSQGRALEALKAALQTRLGSRYSVIYPATQGERVSQMLAGYQMGLGMFSAIAIFVGAFLIYNAFSMTVVERTREIGMLRTLGMTRRQVMSQILVEAGVLGMIGALFGLAAGIGLAGGLIRLMTIFLAQEVRRIQIPTSGLVISFVIGIVVTLAAAAVPAFQASRVSPLEALRVRGRSRAGWFAHHGWIVGVALIVSGLLLVVVRLPPPMGDHTQDVAVMALLLGAAFIVPKALTAWERAVRPVIRRLYGDEGALGSRNIQRALLRTALTVSALMIGVAMILSIRAVTDAFALDIRTWIERYIGGDVWVSSTLNLRPDLARRLNGVEGVAEVASVRYLDVKRIKPEGSHESLSLMAVDPIAYTRVTSFVFTSGQGNPERMVSRLAAGDAIFISSVLAEKNKLKRGDTMRLLTRRGQHDFEIAGVVVDFYNQGRVLHMGSNDLRRYYGVNDASTFLIKVQRGQSPAAVQERIDRLYGRSYHLTVESNQEIRERAMRLIGQTSSMFDVLALISMIVAALGVVNTLTMNVVERTREIGMLRSLGMTRRQVAKMILAEAGMMGVGGGVLGIAIGLLMAQTVISSMNTMAGFSMGYVISAQGIIVGFVVAVVVSQLAALWPARRAAQLRVIEAIQFE